MCLELRISSVQRRGLQSMLAHGYLVAIQTVAGAGLFPHMVEDSLKAFREQSSRFLHPVFVGDTLYPALEVNELTPQRTTGVVGCAPCPAKATSRSCDSTAQPRLRSTRDGSRATSRS